MVRGKSVRVRPGYEASKVLALYPGHVVRGKSVRVRPGYEASKVYNIAMQF